jgi:predicted methyltransferase
VITSKELNNGSLLELAHKLVGEQLQAGDTVLDATLGNGHDALFLARCVGSEGELLGFDIQQDALDVTRGRLDEAGIDPCSYKLFCESHSDMTRHVSTRVRAIMFNLGYLPGGNKEIITQKNSTIEAISSALALLSPGGILTVMCYPGHPGGAEEADLVISYLDELDTHEYLVTCYKRMGSGASAPFLCVVHDAKGPAPGKELAPDC